MSGRVIIVGAGVVGLSLAWELRQRGFDVTILERDHPGSGTSWTASGILPPANFATATDPIDRLRGLSHRIYPKWHQRLLELTGIDIGLRRCGGWYLANSVGEAASMAATASYWNEMDIAIEQVETSEVQSREPSIEQWLSRQSNANAWWAEDEYQIRPPRLIKALTAACQQTGVAIVNECQASGFGKSLSTTVSLTTNQGEFHADHIVFCSGAWTGMIDDQLRLNQSIVPIRGQIVLLKSDRPVLNSIVNFGNRYLIARPDGYTLVGSCEEEVGFNLTTDESMLGELTDFAFDMIPELETAQNVRSWAGLRPLTFDGFPMIGQVPGHERIFVAAGHYRSGIHLAPATAVLLADTFTGRTPAIDLSSFRVGKQQSNPSH